MKYAPLTLVAAALLAAPVWAQDAKPEAPKHIQPVPTLEKQPTPKKEEEKKVLSVGDKAPEYKVEAFIKGAPVTSFEKGKVYVIEFWATWCVPCADAFPHLSKAQAEYKDKVTFIGTNVWEKKYSADTLEDVKAFVQKHNDDMAYTVAYDGSSRAMDNAYMKAAGRGAIPCAFIINQEGTIAWIGHPLSMDKVLAEVVAGKYDLEAAKAEKDIKVKIADAKTKVNKSRRTEKWDDAVAAFDELVKLDPANSESYLRKKFAMLANEKKDLPAAYAMKDAMLADKNIGESSKICNEIAWRLVDPKGDVPAKNRDLDFAMAFANRANELTKGEDGMILDTVARVYWEKGDRAKAIELQEKAVKQIEKDTEVDENMKSEIKATLEQYKKDNAKSGA